jgi:hypothetical protein
VVDPRPAHTRALRALAGEREREHPADVLLSGGIAPSAGYGVLSPPSGYRAVSGRGGENLPCRHSQSAGFLNRDGPSAERKYKEASRVVRVIELRVETDTVVALTLHPRLTIIDAGPPNDILINAIRSLVHDDQVKMHAVVSEGDRHHLRDADELRVLGWRGDAVMLDIDALPPLVDKEGKTQLSAIDAKDGPVADLAAKVLAAGRAAEAAEAVVSHAAEVLKAADAQSETIVAGLRSHEEAIEELKGQQAEVELRLSDLTKRHGIVDGHLDALSKLRTEPPRTPDELIAVIESFDALPAESVHEIQVLMLEWNRPVLSTYDLLMGSHQAPSSLEEQFGLTPSQPADGPVVVAGPDRNAGGPPLPTTVLTLLDQAQLTLTAQAERIKEISVTIGASVKEQTKAVTDRQRQFTMARAGMLARTGDRETMRHQYERAVEAASSAREQLADLEVAGRLVQHIATMPCDFVAGRPPLVLEHRSNDAAHRDQLLRALPLISRETQVVVVTSDSLVLDWARGLGGIDGALRSASAF